LVSSEAAGCKKQKMRDAEMQEMEIKFGKKCERSYFPHRNFIPLLLFFFLLEAEYKSKGFFFV